MSKNRDKELDIKNTKRILNNLPVEPEGKKNWLDHSDGGAIIDKMLLKGAIKKDLDKICGRDSGSSSHISHLRNEHGLSITKPKIGSIYRFYYKENFEGIEQEKKNLEDEYNEQIKKIKETEKEAVVSQRVGQDSLRKLLLQLYKNKCAMCDVDAVEVLRASHIVPWSEDESTRLDPTNAILLCGLHDLAFDKGLITVNNDFLILLPNKPDGLRDVLNKFTRSKLRLPVSKEYYPKIEYLQRHKNMNSK